MNKEIKLRDLKHELYFEQKKLDEQQSIVTCLKNKIRRIENSIAEKYQLKLFD